MSSAQQILQALQKTVMGSSTEQIKNAETVLKTLENSPNFVEDIGLILQESKVQANLHKAAAVYLGKHANNVVKSRNQQLINTTAQKILKLLASYKINIKHKVFISRALQFMISTDKSKILRAAFEPNLICLLGQSEQQPDQQVNFEYLVFLGQILMSNPGFTQQVMRFITKTFLPFTKLTIRVELLLQQVLITQNAELVTKLLFIVKEYLYLLKIYLKRFLFVDVEANKLLFMPELEVVVSKALDIKLPNNSLQHSIFYLTPQPTPQSRYINEIKSNAVSFLNNLIRTLMGIVKQPKILQLNPIYTKTSQYLETFILASQQLMKSHPYYKIQDLSVLTTLDQVYAFYITTIRTNSFYQIFVQYKEKMIEDLIFRALILTPNDYDNYYEQPEEFINSLVHVIERDIKIKQRKQPDEEQDQIESFATLKTHAAEFLNTFCKYQDGTLTEIMNYAKLIIEGSINNAEFSPSLMLIVITILRDVSKQRKDLHFLINSMLMKCLDQMEIPTKKTEQPESNSTTKQLDVQYSLLLLLLSKTFSIIQSVNPKIIDKSFKLCHQIINDPKVEEVPKLLAIDIIEVINHLEEGEPYSPDILRTFNSLLKADQKPNHRLLEAYFSLIKYNDVILKKLCYKQLCQMINILALLIHKQIQSPNKEQIIINKLWNVIREVGQNPQFIPIMIEPIENAIMPLLPYVDSGSNIDFEEDILMLMSAFIGKSHQVTPNQLKMFEIIPKVFYNQYKAVFGHSFQTMQTFIYYGKEILKSSPAAINSIIHMALTSISTKEYKGRNLLESDNCQGALLLQSLIAACGLTIDIKMYEEIVQTIRKRLAQQIKYDLLRANLVALLALVLIHSCQNFSNDVNDIILSSILNDISCFKKVKNAPKVLIIALNKLLLKYHHEFVQRRYTQILDTIITLLQMISMKKNNLFEEDDDDEERDYENSLVQTMNDIINIDEFQDFKNQIKSLKQKNLQLIQSTVSELPQGKKDFLKNVLAVERVSNQPRKIFTIKRNN